MRREVAGAGMGGAERMAEVREARAEGMSQKYGTRKDPQIRIIDYIGQRPTRRIG